MIQDIAKNIFLGRYGNIDDLFVREPILGNIILNPTHWIINDNVPDYGKIGILNASTSFDKLEEYNIIDGSAGGLVLGQSHKEIGGIPIIMYEILPQEKGMVIYCVGHLEGFEYVIPHDKYAKKAIDKFNEPLTYDFEPYEIPKEITTINAKGNSLLLVPYGKLAIINKTSTKKYLREIEKFNSKSPF